MRLSYYLKEFYKSLEISELLIEWVRAHRFALFVLVLITSVWGLLLVLNVRNVNSLLIDIREMEKQSKELENINERYLYEIVNLQSAERIIKIAEEQLNMEQSLKAPDIIK